MVERKIGFPLKHVLCTTDRGICCKFCGEYTGTSIEHREEKNKTVHQLREEVSTWACRHRCNPKNKLVWKIKMQNKIQNE